MKDYFQNIFQVKPGHYEKQKDKSEESDLLNWSSGFNVITVSFCDFEKY